MVTSTDLCIFWGVDVVVTVGIGRIPVRVVGRGDRYLGAVTTKGPQLDIVVLALALVGGDLLGDVDFVLAGAGTDALELG